jgi:hypothetical protein
MTGTIAPVREIVIVIADFYLEPQLIARPATAAALAPLAPAPGTAAPGLGHLGRFGRKTAVPEGWRAWVARWLGLSGYAGEAPASIAAIGLADVPVNRAVWLATPVSLAAGLTSLHFDRRSLLRLPPEELAVLAAGFRETFHGSGFDLHPLAGGELLLSAPALAAASSTTEPARVPLMSVAEALPRGEGAAVLRRLGAEMEMWLHGHPLNEARARRGAPRVATLWVWGGGALPASRAAVPREMHAAAFGADAYVRGLWRLAGAEARPMPVDWAAVSGERGAQRVLAAVEVAELLHADASWTLADAVAAIDRRLLSPSLDALRRGELDRLVLVANDRSIALRAVDRWRRWRRKRPGLEALA